jgi:DNA-binding transcriptional regulator YhcF (GntR family)
MNTRGSKKRAFTIDEQEPSVEKTKKQKTMVNSSSKQDASSNEETDARIRLLIQELDRLGHSDTARHLENQSV